MQFVSASTGGMHEIWKRRIPVPLYEKRCANILPMSSLATLLVSHPGRAWLASAPGGTEHLQKGSRIITSGRLLKCSRERRSPAASQRRSRLFALFTAPAKTGVLTPDEPVLARPNGILRLRMGKFSMLRDAGRKHSLSVWPAGMLTPLLTLFQLFTTVCSGRIIKTCLPQSNKPVKEYSPVAYAPIGASPI